MYMGTWGRWMAEICFFSVMAILWLVRWVDNQSILMIIILFLYVQLIYYIHQSFTEYTDFN